MIPAKEKKKQMKQDADSKLINVRKKNNIIENEFKNNYRMTAVPTKRDDQKNINITSGVIFF